MILILESDVQNAKDGRDQETSKFSLHKSGAWLIVEARSRGFQKPLDPGFQVLSTLTLANLCASGSSQRHLCFGSPSKLPLALYSSVFRLMLAFFNLVSCARWSKALVLGSRDLTKFPCLGACQSLPQVEEVGALVRTCNVAIELRLLTSLVSSLNAV